MFADERGGGTTTVDDLSTERQDILDEMRVVLRRIRVCSCCRAMYSLSNSIGRLSCKNGHDHLNVDTEPYAQHREMHLDYKLAWLLGEEGLLPDWLTASLETNEYNPNLTLVHKSELDRYPDKIIIHRLCQKNR